MNIKDAIKDCEVYLQQIRRYNPEPFYVDYFFSKYIDSVYNVLDGIFEEANRDFGLFVSEKISQETFHEKAKTKNDQNAVKFSEWYLTAYEQEHKNPYPSFMKDICQFKKKFQRLPEIKIMLRASEVYKDDIYQQIKVGLTNQKIRSKEELEIQIKRQMPIYLEIINHKRRQRNEPKVSDKQVRASAFLDVSNHRDIEIVYAAQIYIPVMKRLVEQAAKKIRELTAWN